MQIIYEPKHGDTIDALDTMYPTLSKWYEKSDTFGQKGMTTYGYLMDGVAAVEANDQVWPLKAGNYFAVHGEGKIIGQGFKMWTVARLGYKCMPMMGQVESNGRLSYIDGCSDSVLVSMPRYGDPVLNYLHFPTGILQTQHTHPSIRMGVVIGGEGQAWQEKGNYHDGWERPLSKGCMFMLEEQELHSFKTEDNFMDIIAYHPDSDTGPTDENHSMINRTYIDHGK